MKKRLMTCLYLEGEKTSDERMIQKAAYYSDNGADASLVFDRSEGDNRHDLSVGHLKKICDVSEIPVYAGGNIRRMEDVKKYLYAGCAKTILDFSKESNISLLEEVSKRFGKDKMVVSITEEKQFWEHKDSIVSFASELLVYGESPAGIIINTLKQKMDSDAACINIIVAADAVVENDVIGILNMEMVSAFAGPFFENESLDLQDFKFRCRERGLDTCIYESNVAWSDFKLNSDGMIPVIVQDYKTDEVLMLAYMNEEAFQTTLRTGKMTYWSRSRNELWTKGLTSGHLQYVKSLALDCDNDTILAKVAQIGAACHTGNRSCFFQSLMAKEYKDTNPLHVFQDVYDVILDRKANPKEGSYTNYLFDKGIDKILKKVGEECTEIVIAAKNPDKEEIKYEIADFLYHVMVLMAEKGVTWEEITRELARR
ncbi:MAG: bifunctional phosphoribosyl-AMP cyclohydrolase/phosphoribosyl-ATP diphosphatase HisIE [Blautia sp.]|nr:bifunctional phosphoribosyl-AMP cyclohydrolase/phosphoribosyl-ATP diphosphatase HisIE [Blautia sp.]